jgi:outer membrane lipoprotein-sorting protein
MNKLISFTSMLFFLLLFGNNKLIAQKSVNTVVYGVYAKMQKIKDYSAEAQIIANLPLIKALPVRANVYFKQKNKFRIISKGIAVLPKQGFNDLQKLISDTNSFTAINTGGETINAIANQILNIIPSNDTGDVVLAKLWIDPSTHLVHKSQITSRENGTVVVEYFYKTNIGFGLPDVLVFTVDVKKFKIPKGIATDINKSNDDSDKNKKDAKYGKITISLSNYIINKGVKDEIFK